MLKHIFTPFIKQLILVILLIIQTGAFSFNPRTPNIYTEQWVACDPNDDLTTVYSENSKLHLQIADRACTIVVVGTNTSLEIHNPENMHVLSMPIDKESGWLFLNGKLPINLYYSGIYNIYFEGKLQEILLQLPTVNSKVIYEKGTRQEYRVLKSAELRFVPLEFQSQIVTVLSAENAT